MTDYPDPSDDILCAILPGDDDFVHVLGHSAITSWLYQNLPQPLRTLSREIVERYENRGISRQQASTELTRLGIPRTFLETVITLETSGT